MKYDLDNNNENAINLIDTVSAIIGIGFGYEKANSNKFTKANGDKRMIETSFEPLKKDFIIIKETITGKTKYDKLVEKIIGVERDYSINIYNSYRRNVPTNYEAQEETGKVKVRIVPKENNNINVSFAESSTNAIVDKGIYCEKTNPCNGKMIQTIKSNVISKRLYENILKLYRELLIKEQEKQKPKTR